MSGNPTRTKSGFVSTIGAEELPSAATPDFLTDGRQARWARTMERTIADLLEDLIDDIEPDDIAHAV